MNNNNDKKSNIKQISILVILILITILGIFTTNNYNKNNNDTNQNVNATISESYTLDNIPPYSSSPFVVINNNIPNFKDEDFSTTSFENYSDLDNLGRCGVAFANLNQETMPKEDEKRKSLDDIIPTGWNDVKYDIVRGKNLYNKCHLIAFSLSAENDNAKNIITGTRYFNVSGMLPYELKVLNYLKTDINRHVLYRVKPIFEGDNKLASGATIEIASVEDKGENLHYYVYVYNVQPGIIIDYANGESRLAELKI